MNLNKTRTKECGTFTLKLEGYGTSIPWLNITDVGGDAAESYVDSKDLRKIGKQLIKWADKLDAHEEAEASGA